MSLCKKNTPCFWLIITKHKYFGATIEATNNWIIEAFTKDEAIQEVLQRFFSDKPQHTVKIEYVTNSIENPALVRGYQIVRLNKDAEVDPEIFELADSHLI